METIKRLGQWEKRVGEMLLADIGSIRLKSCATFIIKKTVTEIQSEAEGGRGGGEVPNTLLPPTPHKGDFCTKEV